MKQSVLYLSIFIVVLGCSKEMAVQNRNAPGKNPIVLPPPGTERYRAEETMTADDTQVSEIATREILERGAERFQIHCLPCHGISGQGDGIVVQRGFPKPPALDSASVKRRSDDDLYRIVSNGTGKMAGFRNFISEADRKSIVAYVRLLQIRHRISEGVK